VTMCVTLCCLCGCWLDRRGGVGLSFGPTVSESYQLSGVVTALHEVERPLADVRVSAVYQGEEFAAAITDVRGRFFIDVDRNPLQNPAPRSSVPPPPPGGRSGMDALGSGALVISSSGEVVMHNYAAIPTHEHWTVELRVVAESFRTRKVRVEVPRDLSKEPVKMLLLPK